MINNEQWYKNQLKISIISLILLVIISIGVISYTIYIENNTTMNPSHVYVCDNPNSKSEFDKWLIETLKIDWVPSYLIIKDQSVIAAFDGCISENYFSSKFGTALALNIHFTELPDYQITNLLGERKSLNKIFKSDQTYIVEIHWIKCKDCIYQDEHYTQDIYNKYSTKNIYRYYIKSEFKDVESKYSSK